MGLCSLFLWLFGLLFHENSEADHLYAFKAKRIFVRALPYKFSRAPINYSTPFFPLVN